MKTTTLVATLVGAGLLFAHPVFAQNNDDPAAHVSAYGDASDATAPSFDEPWDTGDTALAPAPAMPEYVEPGLMYVPPPPVGLIEPGNHPAISPTSPTLIPPDSFARPAGVFNGRIR